MKKEQMIKLIEENNVDAMMLFSDQNRYWYSNFKSSLGYIFVTKNKSYLLLDGRYITAAKEHKNMKNIDEIIMFKNGLFNQIKEILAKENVEKLGFESDWLKYNEYQYFYNYLNPIKMVPVNTEKIRMIKEKNEIDNIKKACDITNLVFQDVIKWIKPGVTEKEVSIFVNDSFLRHGAEKLSFDTIVASGINGSKPHAVPTDKVINNGELVTLDMGCYYNGYVSDQTRTFLMGETVDQKLIDIYNTVYEAQSLGISMLKPGVKTSDIHNKVDKFITEKGYDGYFNHGLGHGIGVEIHEEPYENKVSQEILKPGMTITVEPGIYIPGVGGVRIEDDFLITETGYEYLTSSPRELIKIK